MRKNLLIVAVLFVAPAMLDAMSLAFERTWGGANEEVAEGVAVAPDGSVYLAGTTLSFGVGDQDAFLVKYGPDGTILWERTWGTARVVPNLRADDSATDVAAAADGAYVTGFSGNHVFLVKFDNEGNVRWQVTWARGATDFAWGVAVTPDGLDVYIAGTTEGFGDAFLVKFSSGGTLIWQKTWGGAGSDVAQDVTVAPDGSIYIGGETNSFFANDAFLAKFAPDGTLLWDRAWRQGTIEDLSGALGVAAAADGVYLTGYASISLVGQDIFLVKFTPDGDLVWEKTWGDKLSTAHGVTVATDGTVYVTGNTGFGQGNGDAFVVRFLANGKIKDASTWGGGDNDGGQSIVAAAAPDGSVYVGGYVGGAPPYVFDRARQTTKRPDAFLGVPNGAVVDAGGTVGPAGGSAMMADGSETFAGATDAFLLKILP